MASRRPPLMYVAVIGLVVSGYATPGAAKDFDPNSNTDWLGVTAGDEAGSETELAADMAELFATTAQLRVVPVPGDSGLQNISRLLRDPHIDAGFVSTDVLAGANAQNALPNLAEKLEVVARFCPQEVHVLARQDITDLNDLAHKKVNFGPDGSSSALTASILFKALGIGVVPVALDGRAAVDQLSEGLIAADVIV